MSFFGLDLSWSVWIANVIVFLGGIIVVVFTALGSRWNDALTVQKDIQYTADIAKADARAAEAEKQAAAANLKAAEANERTAKLEIEAADARTREAEAQTRLEVDRQARLKIEESLKPRRLSDERRTAFTHALAVSAQKGTIHVNCVNGDAEGCEYARELRACLEAAGWPVPEQGGVLGLSGFGLLIMVKDGKTPPPHAFELRNIMRSVGLSADASENQKMPQDRVILFVGSKN